MPDSLSDWLAYIERVHARPIDLGLDRVLRVKRAMGLTQSVPLITVGGTNGKGSTCAMIESHPVMRRLPRRPLYLAPLAALQRARANQLPNGG